MTVRPVQPGLGPLPEPLATAFQRLHETSRRHAEPLRDELVRAVEAQHRVGTRRLVDSDAEQQLLEDLLERAKPPLPPDTEHLHFLLATPFRYPPLRNGSRFGTRWHRGIFYAALHPHTSLAEVSYYRLVFLDGTSADIEPLVAEFTLFRVRLEADHGLDLADDRFAAFRELLSSPTDYTFPQHVGHALREDGFEAIYYPSARDPIGRRAAAVFSPRAFGSRNPSGFERWHSFATRAGVEWRKMDFLDEERLRFPRRTFEVDGRLPTPAT